VKVSARSSDLLLWTHGPAWSSAQRRGRQQRYRFVGSRTVLYGIDAP